MANSNTIILSPNLHTFYSKVFLETAEKNLVVWQCGDARVHPQGTGKVSKYLRYGNVNPTLTPLSEGVTPAENSLATNQYQIEIKQYGDFIIVTDFLQMTSISPEIKKHSERLGYAAAKSMDSQIIAHLEATATNSLYYTNNANTIDDDVQATETFSARSVLAGVGCLRGQDAKPFADGMFKWVVHPHAAIDIMSDTAAGGFIDLNKYTSDNTSKILKGEVGKVYGARLIESSNMTAPTAALTDVYRSFLMAEDAFVMTKFNKDAMSLIIKPNGSAGSADPLDQRASVAYKLQFGVLYTGGDFVDANGASPDTCIQIRGAATGC